jgi:hypothetical protein
MSLVIARSISAYQATRAFMVIYTLATMRTTATPVRRFSSAEKRQRIVQRSDADPQNLQSRAAAHRGLPRTDLLLPPPTNGLPLRGANGEQVSDHAGGHPRASRHTRQSRKSRQRFGTQQTANRVGKPLPDRASLRESAPPAAGQRIDPPPSSRVSSFPTGNKQTGLLEPVESRVNRPLWKIERATALAANFLDYSVTVRRSPR